MYSILQYVIFQSKLCFDHEFNVEKMAVSGVYFVF